MLWVLFIVIWVVVRVFQGFASVFWIVARVLGSCQGVCVVARVFRMVSMESGWLLGV